MKTGEPQLAISTRRLIIRPYRLTDFKAWKTACEKRAPRRNPFESPHAAHLLEREGFKKWILDRRRLQKNDFVYVFGIFDRRTCEHIGTIDIAVIRRLSVQWANLGYAIHNHLWGRGYATEAVRAGLVLAFKEMKLHRVEAAIDPGNRASLKVARRAGLVREGVRRKFYFYNGAWQDCVLYAATPETCALPAKPPSVRASIRDYL